MQRLVGGILIITATAGAGYVYGTELKKYLGKIQYLRYIVGLMKGEIEYTGAPLSEVFSSVARRVKEPYRNWLGQLSARTESRDESGFSRIWNKCINRYLLLTGLCSSISIEWIWKSKNSERDWRQRKKSADGSESCPESFWL